MLRWLNDTESMLSVQAEAAEEAITFLHAAVGQLPLIIGFSGRATFLLRNPDDIARQLDRPWAEADELSLTAAIQASPQRW